MTIFTTIIIIGAILYFIFAQEKRNRYLNLKINALYGALIKEKILNEKIEKYILEQLEDDADWEKDIVLIKKESSRETNNQMHKLFNPEYNTDLGKSLEELKRYMGK